VLYEREGASSSSMRIKSVRMPVPVSIVWLRLRTQRFSDGPQQMRVWLKRKLAERIDGVDLSDYNVGDTLELSPREASSWSPRNGPRPSAACRRCCGQS
jgi:hypothetical protein